MGDFHLNPHFGAKIGSRLNTAINGAIDEVKASHWGAPEVEVEQALIDALARAWPSGIRLSNVHMKQLTSGIAYQRLE